MTINIPTGPGRFIAGTSGVVRTIGGVGGIWVVATQSRNYGQILHRQKNPIIAGQVLFDRHHHGIMQLSMESTLGLAKLIGNEHEQRKLGHTFTSKYGRRVAHDLFLEHSLNEKCLPPLAAISLSLVKFLKTVGLLDILEKVLEMGSLFYSPISTIIYVIFQYYCSISPRAVNLILLTYAFVFIVIGYFDADKKYCLEYVEFFSNEKNIETRKNVLLFTVNFVLYGTGFLPQTKIKKLEEKSLFKQNTIPKSCYLDKNFLLSSCFQDETFALNID